MAGLIGLFVFVLFVNDIVTEDDLDVIRQLQYPFWTYLAWQPFLEAPTTPAQYGLIPHGIPETIDFRLYFRDSLGPISPFHDIPLYVNDEKTILRMVVEIPRWSNAKFEISNDEVLNPIKQSTKNGKVRFAPNLFPYHGYMWNYGAFPQTWESPNVDDPVTGFHGDNDPLDILEIGTRVAKVGDVVEVKIIGALGLVDQGETDWKILVINVNDNLAKNINSVCDIEKYFPGLLQATRDWLRHYKLAEGKSINNFASDGKIYDSEFARIVINRTHGHWKNLINDTTVKSVHSRSSVTQVDSPYYLPRSAVMGFTIQTDPTFRETMVDFGRHKENSWYFMNRPEDKIQNCTKD